MLTNTTFVLPKHYDQSQNER